MAAPGAGLILPLYCASLLLLLRGWDLPGAYEPVFLYRIQTGLPLWLVVLLCFVPAPFAYKRFLMRVYFLVQGQGLVAYDKKAFQRKCHFAWLTMIFVQFC